MVVRQRAAAVLARRDAAAEAVFVDGEIEGGVAGERRVDELGARLRIERAPLAAPWISSAMRARAGRALIAATALSNAAEPQRGKSLP